ncbi:helix-turn-helix transcriptional regulator [Agathobaculum sp. NTUH-O15-33]|uniref:helix-turn-helix domain-containing protein n=1 Tax=Agathobaculum sp. NTUH-O15-33 TaxID=3079302 RepID=UPI0029583447|nr:helix-turn-helix transcriptional regulator [Agathobaculum sp. NTUH-O15-33]WNX86387.1 helix-turn-helix transcriptional regulator [Agathobaculum sp. NTUH-O15-33]
MVDYRVLIRKRRLEKHLTQKQLAEMSDITQPYLYEIESGRKSPSIDVLAKICEVLEIKLFPDE